MFNRDPTTAKEPKRERGKQRVAALIDAGAELFAEKGYEATTMTEIATRAGAAIGSLYQFFPSKEALAEALFNRFAERARASSRARRGPCARALGGRACRPFHRPQARSRGRSGRGARAFGRGRGNCRAQEAAWRGAARRNRRHSHGCEPRARRGRIRRRRDHREPDHEDGPRARSGDRRARVGARRRSAQASQPLSRKVLGRRRRPSRRQSS